MADPERNIEKWLREYAANRRREGGEPPPLHPAVRRSLQAEVNNRYGRKPTGFSILALFRPAWGWQLGAVAAALVVVGLVLFNRPPAPAKHEFFAKNEAPQAATEKLRAATPASAAGAAPAELPAPATERKLAVAPAAPVTLAQEASPSVPQPAAARSYLAARDESTPQPRQSEAAPVADLDVGLAKDKEVASVPNPNKSDALQSTTRYGAAGRAAIPEPSAAAAATTTALAAAEAPQPAPTNALPVLVGTEFAMRPDSSSPPALNALPLTGTQSFRQIIAARAKAAKSSTSPVLASFRVEQSGNSLRIVDNDGSIYTGSFLTALADNQNQPVALQSANFKRAANVTDSLSTANQLQQNLPFRVLGTNRSLKQKVVFTGNIIGFDNSNQFTASNAVPQVSNQAKTQLKLQSNQQILNNNQLLQNSTISGQAVVGGNNILRVQAVPTQSP